MTLAERGITQDLPVEQREDKKPFSTEFRRTTWDKLRKGEVRADVLVISDIHTGASFSNLKRAGDLIEAVPANLVVIAGDLSEYEFPGNHLSERDWEQLRRIKADIVLPGNHDSSLPMSVLEAVGVKELTPAPYVIEKGGVRIAIIHGHEGEGLFPKEGDPIRIISDIAHGTTLKFGFLKGIHDKLGNRVYSLAEKVQNFALEVAREKQAQIVLHGHVHEVKETIKDGVKIINFGDFIHRRVSFVTIDEQGLVVYTVD